MNARWLAFLGVLVGLLALGTLTLLLRSSGDARRPPNEEERIDSREKGPDVTPASKEFPLEPSRERVDSPDPEASGGLTIHGEPGGSTRSDRGAWPAVAIPNVAR